MKPVLYFLCLMFNVLLCNKSILAQIDSACKIKVLEVYNKMDLTKNLVPENQMMHIKCVVTYKANIDMPANTDKISLETNSFFTSYKSYVAMFGIQKFSDTSFFILVDSAEKMVRIGAAESKEKLAFDVKTLASVKNYIVHMAESLNCVEDKGNLIIDINLKSEQMEVPVKSIKIIADSKTLLTKRYTIKFVEGKYTYDYVDVDFKVFQLEKISELMKNSFLNLVYNTDNTIRSEYKDFDFIDKRIK